MKLELIEEEVKHKQAYVQNLEASLEYLHQDKSKEHKEAIYLVDYEIFYVKDQLGNYEILLNILREEAALREGANEQKEVPEQK